MELLLALATDVGTIFHVTYTPQILSFWEGSWDWMVLGLVPSTQFVPPTSSSRHLPNSLHLCHSTGLYVLSACLAFVHQPLRLKFSWFFQDPNDSTPMQLDSHQWNIMELCQLTNYTYYTKLWFTHVYSNVYTKQHHQTGGASNILSSNQSRRQQTQLCKQMIQEPCRVTRDDLGG